MADLAGAGLAAMAALWLAGALAGWLLGARGPRALVPVHLLGLLGGLAGGAAGLAALLDGGARRIALPASLPYARPELLLDGLAGLFLLLVSAGAVVASVYAMGYLRHDAARGRLRALGACYHLFLLAMAGVVLANDAVSFLIAWESMSLASLGLVLAGQRGPEGTRAGLVYIATMHVGTGLILAALLLAAQHAGGWSFDAFRAAGATMPEPARALAFAFSLLGFGIKAGIVPLHGWLPLAHPAAPSHVSALMSGVMIKLGVLMLLRFTLEFLGPLQAWWGVVILGAGLASALLGVLFALAQHDLKRLLAFHSVENIGIILIAAGAAVLLATRGLASLATLALAAALFHTVNHMVFKSLLFLGSGAVVEAAGSRDLERLGGLARRMPFSAACFLVGAMAISALPPLNGFASEWMVFQALVGLLAGLPSSPVLAAFVVGAAAVLALTSALAAACFVKAYGAVFAGSPRSEGAARAQERGLAMLLPMGALAALCGALGVGAGLAVAPLVGVAAQLLHTSPFPVPGSSLPGVAGAAMDPLLVAVLVLAGTGLALVVSRRGAASVSRGSVWACGEVEPAPRFQSTATAFASPVLTVFRSVLRPTLRVEAEGPCAPYTPSRLVAEAGHEDVFQRRLYEPLPRFVQVFSMRLRRIQSGSLHAYIAYLFGALLLTLLVVVASR